MYLSKLTRKKSLVLIVGNAQNWRFLLRCLQRPVNRKYVRLSFFIWQLPRLSNKTEKCTIHIQINANSNNFFFFFDVTTVVKNQIQFENKSVRTIIDWPHRLDFPFPDLIKSRRRCEQLPKIELFDAARIHFTRGESKVYQISNTRK